MHFVFKQSPQLGSVISVVFVLVNVPSFINRYIFFFSLFFSTLKKKEKTILLNLTVTLCQMLDALKKKVKGPQLSKYLLVSFKTGRVFFLKITFVPSHWRYVPEYQLFSNPFFVHYSTVCEISTNHVPVVSFTPL